VKGDLTARDLRDALKAFIDSNDELLVVEITGDAAAWAGFSDDGSRWLRDNL